MSSIRRIKVTEVHNFGGFFGGDTVTLSAAPWPEGEEETLTIDDKALTNVVDRHTIAPDMLLELHMAGERVDQARLLAAREYETLRAATGTLPRAEAFDRPQIRAYYCAGCELWIADQPEQQDNTLICGLCAIPLA